DRRPAARLDWILLFYVLGLVLVSIWPLEVTLRGADLQRKYHAGLIAFIPFREANLILRCFTTALLAVPVGMFVATVSTTSHHPVRSKESTLVLGVLLLVFIESIQLLILGKYATATDPLIGLAGIVAGLAISVYLHGGWRKLSARRSREFSTHYMTRVAPYVVAAFTYAGVLGVILCLPWNPTSDTQLLSSRFSQLFHAPLAIFARQSLADCLADWASTAALFAPLGAVWALAIAGPSIPQPIRRVLFGFSVMFIAGVALAIEIMQVQLPHAYPSLTDVAAATAGSALGMLAAYVWLRRRRRSTPADMLSSVG
ncbi:MAG: VanZ family protein, partial [Planctomycetales bacterium]|nr:VanZ family protein [Planctomycetales bacterium]